jgi:predicted Zn-dependent peptidase
MSLESPDSLMNYVYIQDHYGFPEDYWDRYPSQIDKVSSEDVMRIGQKYFRPGLMHVIAVGDPAIRSALQAWGPPEDQNP